VQWCTSQQASESTNFAWGTELFHVLFPSTINEKHGVDFLDQCLVALWFFKILRFDSMRCEKCWRTLLFCSCLLQALLEKYFRMSSERILQLVVARCA